MMQSQSAKLTNTRLTAALVTSMLPNPVFVSAKLCQCHTWHTFIVHMMEIQPMTDKQTEAITQPTWTMQ